jgi:hypothetical protein
VQFGLINEGAFAGHRWDTETKIILVRYHRTMNLLDSLKIIESAKYLALTDPLLYRPLQ